MEYYLPGATIEVSRMDKAHLKAHGFSVRFDDGPSMASVAVLCYKHH